MSNVSYKRFHINSNSNVRTPQCPETYISIVYLILGGDPRNFYDGRGIEIRVKFVLRRKISTRDNLLREKVSQGVLYYGLGSYTTGQNL